MAERFGSEPELSAEWLSSPETQTIERSIEEIRALIEDNNRELYAARTELEGMKQDNRADVTGTGKPLWSEQDLEAQVQRIVEIEKAGKDLEALLHAYTEQLERSKHLDKRFAALPPDTDYKN